MFEKIWQRHVVVDRDDGYTLLYVDRHLMHEGSAGPFAQLRERGLAVRNPHLGFATPDHYVTTSSRRTADIPDQNHRRLVEEIAGNATASGVTLFDLGDERQGIAHVVGPEQGVTLPGATLVCGDSPHLHPWRTRRTRIRHRHVRGAARAGDAMPVAAQAARRCGSTSRARSAQA